ncbi:hypothetical protein L6773_21240, partial [Rhodohalobacter sp. WB101]
MVPRPREKKPERKRKNLMRLGVNPEDAYAWSPDSCRDGRLESRSKPHPENDNNLSQNEETGLYWNSITKSGQRSKPPYTRPVCTVVGEAHRGLIAHGRLL